MVKPKIVAGALAALTFDDFQRLYGHKKFTVDCFGLDDEDSLSIFYLYTDGSLAVELSTPMPGEPGTYQMHFQIFNSYRTYLDMSAIHMGIDSEHPGHRILASAQKVNLGSTVICRRQVHF